MTPDPESRLRAALHDQADEVSPARLTRTLDDALRHDAHAGARRRRPGQSWLVAAAAAVVVAAGASGIVLATRQGTPSPQPVATVTVTPTPRTPTPSAATSVAPGTVAAHEEPRSAIPWAQVGPGWSAASWATSTQATVGDPLPRQPGRDALRRRDDAPGAGSTTSRPTVAGSSPARATPRRSSSGTSPPGRRARSPSASRGRPTRSRTARPSSRPTRAAAPRGRSAAASTGRSSVTFPADTGLARMTPDGLDLVAGTTSGLAVYGNATGTLIRTLPAPPGYGSCQVVSWWPDGRALTRCALGGNGVANLWLYPLDGSAATALTAATAGSATPFGYQDAWPVSTGTLVQEGVGCGVGPLAMLTSPGTSQRIAFTFPGFPALHAPRPRPRGGGGRRRIPRRLDGGVRRRADAVLGRLRRRDRSVRGAHRTRGERRHRRSGGRHRSESLTGSECDDEHLNARPRPRHPWREVCRASSVRPADRPRRPVCGAAALDGPARLPAAG